MGILNVTPDSFYDGGRWSSLGDAIDHGLRMRDEGADWIDVGGESTRPGARPVSEAEELERVIPVVQALAQAGCQVSIDTTKVRVAEAALDAGAAWINDVHGLRDEAMVELVVERQVRVCIMHMQGTPQTMQEAPHYDQLIPEVWGELVERANSLAGRGVPKKWIFLDPGIGFGKRLEHNLSLLKNLPFISDYPILLGVSRKSFIGQVLGREGAMLPVEERLEGTLAVQVYAQLSGVACLRVHDVAAAHRCRTMIQAILNAQ